MIEENKEKLEVSEDAETVKVAEKEVYLPYLNPEQKMEAIAEANLLCNMINSHYFFIHGSPEKRNKRGELIEESRITKSTAISAFEGSQITSFVHRLVEINNKLVAKVKE